MESIPVEGSAQNPTHNYADMVDRMKEYSKQCIQDGHLLEAEEAQIKIEQLKDEEYEVRRTELNTVNDKEMEDLIN